MKQNINEHLIRKYLLGQLPEPEHVRIEESLFSDDEYYSQLLLAEEELTDEYVYDALTAEEREGFERYFLSTPERREEVRIARALKKYVTTNPAVAVDDTPADAAQPSVWERFLAFFSFSGSPVRSFSLGAAALLVLIGGSWFVATIFRPPAPPTQSEAQNGEPPAPGAAQPSNSPPAGGEQTAQDTRPEGAQPPAQHNRNSNTGQQIAGSPGERKVVAPPTAPTTLAFFLTPGQVRAGDINKVTIPAQTAQVKMRLPLLTDTQYGSYQAVLKSDDGREMLRKKGLRAVQAQADRVVEVVLPARMLAEGDYRLELSGQAAAGEDAPLGKYYFRVSKK
jgi:anti-sigma factor RsiW